MQVPLAAIQFCQRAFSRNLSLRGGKNQRLATLIIRKDERAAKNPELARIIHPQEVRLFLFD